MKTIQATYNKGVTVVEEENNSCKVFTFKTKKEFFSYIVGLECLAVHVSSNIKSVIAKIEACGFEVEVDEDYGFDNEVKLYCNATC